MSEGNGKYAPVPGKIPGRPINLGGHELVLAPLSLDQIRHFEPQVKDFDKPNGTLAEQIEAVLPLILASLQRNYEDMTIDHLRPLIDVGNFSEAARAVVDVTGYRIAPPGESRAGIPLDWDAVYARVALATGWTWEYIGRYLTLPRLYAMLDYWKQFPPLHESVAGALGIQPATDAPESAAAPAMLDNATLTRDMHTDPRTLKWQTKAANG